jgi:hypothetical protein
MKTANAFLQTKFPVGTRSRAWPRRASVRPVVFAVVVLSVACSSNGGGETGSGGTSGGPLPSVKCASQQGGGCACQIATAGSFETCDPTQFPGTACCARPGWPGSGQCVCLPPAAIVCASTGLTSAGEGYCQCDTTANLQAANDSPFLSGACPAPESSGGCCLYTQPDGSSFCTCYNPPGRTCTPINGGTAELAASCSPTSVPPPPAQCPSGYTEVSSCSDPTPITGGSGGSSGGTTCNNGPGTCTNPVSANGCRNGGVCERTCATCSYACFVECSTDAQCAGSCDSAGNPLICSSCPNGVCNAGFSACDIKR